MKKSIKYIVISLLLMFIPFVKVSAATDVQIACGMLCLAQGGVTDECMSACQTNADRYMSEISSHCSNVCINNDECNSSCVEAFISNGTSCSDDSCYNTELRKFFQQYINNHHSTVLDLSNHCMQSCDYETSCVPSCVENVRTRCDAACNTGKNQFCINDCMSDYSESDYYCSDDSCDEAFFNKFQNVREQQNSSSSSGNGNSSSGSSSVSGGEVVRATLTCDDVKHATQAYTSLRVIAPILLIIFGSLDFFKAVIAGDVKKQQEARSKFPKRIIALFLLVVLPFVVSFLFLTFGQYNSNNTTIFCCVVSNGNSQCNPTQPNNN